MRLRESLVRGFNGESLFPLQQDGLLKTTTFRWKFYTAEVSLYEELNLTSAGLSAVIQRASQRQSLGPPKYEQRTTGEQGAGPANSQRMLPLSVSGVGGYANGQELAVDGGTLDQVQPSFVDWLNPSNLIGQFT